MIVERYMERSRRDVFDEVRQTAQVNEAARRDFDEVAIRGKLGVLAIAGSSMTNTPWQLSSYRFWKLGAPSATVSVRCATTRIADGS